MADENERLAAIKARRAAATPGPWSAITRPCHTGRVITEFGADNLAFDGVIARDLSHPDAAFIAAAPDDVAWLVTRVEALERERNDLVRNIVDELQLRMESLGVRQEHACDEGEIRAVVITLLSILEESGTRLSLRDQQIVDAARQRLEGTSSATSPSDTA